MAEKLGIKIGIEPGTSERELERKIRDKYKNVNINVGVSPASTGSTQQYVKQTTRGMQDVNTVIAKVIAAYGQLEKMQNKVGKISFSSLSDKLRLDPTFFNGQSGDALKYLMGLQDQIDNMSYDELKTLLKELQNSKKILQPAVDAMHKQQQESISLHNQQKKAREEAAKAAKKAQEARDKAAKSAEKERTEIIKTQQAIKQKNEDLWRLRSESGLDTTQLSGINRLEQYASGAKDGADFDWLINNMNDPSLGLTLSDYKLILSDINKEYTNQRSQISSIKKEVSRMVKLTAEEEKELRDKEKALQNILRMQTQLAKLTKQAAYSGVSLDLDKSLYQTDKVSSAQELLNANPALMNLDQMKRLEADLTNTLGLGNARYSAFKQLQETSTQLSNLNHQIDKYIENNSKIKSNRALYAQLYELHQEIKSGGVNVEDAQERWARLQSKFAELGLETQSLGKRISKLFKDHFNTAVAMAGLHALQNSMREILQAVIDIDAAMTELKKVTDLTDAAYDKFLDRAIEKATILGAKVSDVVTATADFARLGWSVSDAEQLADAAIIYKNVGDGINDISTASESIISTMKAFGYSAEEAMKIVDEFNYVGNNFAISSVGIGEALTRSAAALAQSNNTLEESIALITASNSVIQDPDSVGTALKTLSLRISKTKTELEELGEDTDGVAESTSEYRNEILAITRAAGDAVDIMNTTGTAYKSTYQILKELSAVWDNISQKEQQSLLYMLGGARQVNVLSSLLKNFADAEAVVSQLSDGLANNSAFKENEKYLDSINGKIEQFRANFQALSDDLLNSEAVKGVLDIANAFVKTADAIVEITDVLPLLLAGFTGLMAAEGKTLFRPGYLTKFTKDINGLKKAIQSFNIKDLSLYGLNFDGQRQGGIVRGLSSLLKKPLEEGESWQDRIYSSLGKQQMWMEPDVAAEVQKIIDKYGHDVDALTGKLDNLSASLKHMPPQIAAISTAVKEAMKQFVAIMAVTAVIKTVSLAVDHMFTTVEERQEQIDTYADSLAEAKNELEELRELESNGNAISTEEKARLEYLEEYIAVLTQRKLREEKLLKRSDLTNDGNIFTENTYDTVTSALNSRNGNLLANYASWVPNVQDADLKISASAQADEYYGAVLSEQAFLKAQKAAYEAALATEDNLVYQDKYKQILEDIEKKIQNNDAAIQAANKSGIISLDIVDKIKKTVTDLSQVETWNTIPTIAKEITDSIDWTRPLSDSNGKAKEFKAWLTEIANIKLDNLNSEIDEMQSAFNTLLSAKEEYNAYGSYSLDTLQDLTQLDRRYLNLIIDEEGRLRLNEKAMQDLAQARINEMRIKVITDSIGLIDNIMDEAAAEEYLAKQQADLNTVTYEGAKATLTLAASQAILAGGSIQQAAEMIVNQTNALLNAIGTWDNYGASGSKALDKVNEAAEKAQKDAEKRLRDQGEAMLKALDNRKKALQEEMDALEDKYELEDREFELQKRINAYQAAQANRTVRLYTHDKGWQWVADPTKVKEAQESVEEYQKEIRREDAKQAIQDQIDAIDDLRDKVQDAMNDIGNEFMQNRDNLALVAEFEKMTLDDLGAHVNNYAQQVVDANAAVAASYDTAAAHAAAYFKTIHEQSIKPISDVRDPADIARSQAILNSYTAADVMNGELAYWNDNKKKIYAVQVKHKGGLINGVSQSANVSEQFLAYMNRLKSNEVPAILEAGEYVLTQKHQADILADRATLVNTIRSGGHTTIAIGDIVINQPTGNIESLSKAIVQKLPNQIMKDLYSK